MIKFNYFNITIKDKSFFQLCFWVFCLFIYLFISFIYYLTFFTNVRQFFNFYL